MTDSDPSDKDMAELWQRLQEAASGQDMEWNSVKSDHMSGYVPVEALKVLVEQWDIENTDAFFDQERAMGDDRKMKWAKKLGEEQALKQCAQELQEIIDSYE